MLWTFVCRLHVGQSASGGPRVVIKVPLGSRVRAFQFSTLLGGGRIRGGTVEFEGRELPRVFPMLSAVDGTRRLWKTLETYVASLRKQGGRGYKLTEEERHEQHKLAHNVVVAWSACRKEVHDALVEQFKEEALRGNLR